MISRHKPVAEGVMKTDPNGSYVDYIEHARLVAKLEAERDAAYRAGLERAAELRGCLEDALAWLEDPSAFYGNGNDEAFFARARRALAAAPEDKPAPSECDGGVE